LLVKEPVKEPAPAAAGMVTLLLLLGAKGEGVCERLSARRAASELLVMGGVGWISIKQRAPSSVTTPKKLPLPMDLWEGQHPRRNWKRSSLIQTADCSANRTYNPGVFSWYLKFASFVIIF
jgi:hypothetical protein